MALPKWAKQNVDRQNKYPPLLIECGPIGHYLHELGVNRIDYMSLDVEGSEAVVVQSIVNPKFGIAVGILMVEVRGDGQRRRIAQELLRVGFMFVGQLYGKPSPANEVVSDVYCNKTHLHHHFPTSRALG